MTSATLNRTLTIAAIALFFAGCTHEPDFNRPSGATGAQGMFDAAGAQSAGGIARTASAWSPFRDIWFDPDRSELLPSEQSKVNEIAKHLDQNPSATVAIDGTSDRASSVRSALLHAGVPAHKIQYGTFGDPRMQRDRQVHVLVSAR